MRVLKMSYATHRAEVKAALLVNKKLRATQNSISPSKHPRNALTQIYRITRKRIYTNFTNLAELKNILFIFSSTVRQIITPLITRIELLGITAGISSLNRRKIPNSPIVTASTPNIVTPAVEAIVKIADSQVEQTLAVASIGGAVETVIGDGVNSVGFFSQGTINKQTNIFLTAITALATLTILNLFIAEQIQENIFYKQAIAAIDEVTTECCLIVHGQFQPINNDFSLIGSPRFADFINNPPFHWNCRTATALVHASERYDGLTQEMLQAAARELKARGDTGYRVEIHPAHATSSR